MNLFYDTETTGLIEFKKRSHDPCQPHLVQLAALLMDDEGNEIQSLSVIIEPNGYEIPKEASDVHGITTEFAKKVGIPLEDAVRPFISMAKKADQLVAHNITFDNRVIKIAKLRLPDVKFPEMTATNFCTMNKSKAIVNCPPTAKMIAAGFIGPKVPKLEECIKHFFDEELVGAHDALVDVRACARVYYHLKNNNLIE